MLPAAPLDWCDIALAWDPDARRGDLMLGADGDLALDLTPATPMLIAFGSDRRAEPEDELPDGEDLLNTSGRYARRRGWFGDALAGEAIGSRVWLLNREKETELTRTRCELYLREAFAWADDAPGGPAVVSAAWSTTQRGTLRARVAIGATRLAFAVPLGIA